MGVVIQGDEAALETDLQCRRGGTTLSLKVPVDIETAWSATVSAVGPVSFRLLVLILSKLAFTDETEFSLPLLDDTGFDRFSDGRGGIESGTFFMIPSE